ncbi:uncharacterized protein [Amphiura filiformis]|uniref:uncharacterized protein n=1 Tax=Amphiura filiformis TaxID=82378 RepID=UPI003B21ED39
MKTREKHKSFKTSLLQCARSRQPPQLSPQCGTDTNKINRSNIFEESQSKKRLKSTLQLFVHVDSPEHAIWAVTLEKNSSIKSLKRKISSKYGIREKFELTGADKYQLFELLTIEDHGIQDESNIYFKFAGGLRGGADKNPEEDKGDKKMQENKIPISHEVVGGDPGTTAEEPPAADNKDINEENTSQSNPNESQSGELHVSEKKVLHGADDAEKSTSTLSSTSPKLQSKKGDTSQTLLTITVIEPATDFKPYRYLQVGKAQNGHSLRICIPHCNKTVSERIPVAGWSASLERRRTEHHAPYVFKLQQHKKKLDETKTSLLLNIYASKGEGCKVDVKCGKMSGKTDVCLQADSISVTKNFSSDSRTSFKTSKGNIQINSKVECPVLELCACSGQKNVMFLSESYVICRKIEAIGKTIKVEGKICSQTDALDLVTHGHLHVNTHGEIGKRKSNKRPSEQIIRSVNVSVSGNVWNYGQIFGAKIVNLKCQNFLSCKENKEETIQNGYSAIKFRYKTANADDFNNDEATTIKKLLNAVKNLDKSTVEDMLERGADPLAKVTYGKKKDKCH